MRHLVVGLVVAGITVIAPLGAFASNQDVANQIHDNLKLAEKAGDLTKYRIGVKYQEGTAWLQGRVSSEGEMNKAVEVASNTQGVTRVVNNLVVSAGEESRGPNRAQVQPRKTGLAERLQGIVRNVGPSSQKTQKTPSRPSTTAGSPVAQAAPVEASEVRQASASAPLAAPRPVMEYAVQPAAPVSASRASTQQPLPVGYMQNMTPEPMMMGGHSGAPVPMSGMAGCAPAHYDHAQMPNYAWPSYAAYPNYAGVTYPRQYSPTAWPYIGPFYPYPQVPLGWRRVTLEWDDGWWWLDFKDSAGCSKH